MSEVFQVSTNNLIPTRKANIDGVIYTVRRKGSGDDLDISIRATKLSKLAKKAMSERRLMQSAKTEEEKTRISEKIIRITNEIADINLEIEGIMASLFDDGGDQSKSKAMIHKYGIDGARNILAQIFGGNDDGE